MIVASLLLIAVAAVLLVLGLVRDIDLLLVLSIAVSLVAAVALYLGARQSRAADPVPADEDDYAEEGRTERAGLPRERVGARGSADFAESRSVTEPQATLPVRPVEGHPDWPLRRRPSHDAADGEPERERRDQSRLERNRLERSRLEPGRPDDGRPDQGRPDQGRPDRDVAATAAFARFQEAHAETVVPDEVGVPSDEPPPQRTPRSDADLIARLPAEVLVVDGRPRYHVSGCPHLLDRESEPLPVSEAAELGFTPCAWCQPDTVLLGGTPDG